MEIESSQWNVAGRPRYWSLTSSEGRIKLVAARRSLYAGFGKRLFDLAVSSLLIVSVLSWLTPLLFIFIKLGSRGPLFFIQKRTGQNGKPFHCIKFRTMRINDTRDMAQATKDDERITGIGRFLRVTHIDELPQLINVLLNQMSLIGPRPHMLYHDQLFAAMLPEYSRRHCAKPGITGLAQSRGYYGATPDFFGISARTRLDLFYVENIKAGLDLKILLRTLIIVPLNCLRRAHAS